MEEKNIKPREDIELGNRFKELRASLCLDQKQMSEILGISNSLLSAIELGMRSQKIFFNKEGKDNEFLRTCLREFRCDRETLLGEKELIHAQFDRLKEYSGSLFKIAVRGKNPKEPRKPVFVIGDLCVDTIIYSSEITESKAPTTAPRGGKKIGGQGFLLADAFKEKAGFLPVLFGNTGTDAAGKVIIEEIKKTGQIASFVSAISGKSTGECMITFVGEARTILYNNDDFIPNDANDFSVAQVRTAIRLAGVDSSWIIFVSPAIFARYKARSKNHVENYDKEFGTYIESVMNVLDLPGVPLVMKIPRVFEDLSPDEFNQIIKRADVFYTELVSLKPFYDELGISKPRENDIEKILKKTKGKNGQQIFVFFDGVSNVDSIKSFVRINKDEFKEGKVKGKTGYNADVENRIGFVERYVIDKFIQNVAKLP